MNVELVVQAAEREVDVEKQMQIIENLHPDRASPPSCVTPSGSREIVPAIDKANKSEHSRHHRGHARGRPGPVR